MARLILDTTVLIGVERDGHDAARLIDEDDDVAIAAITAAELLAGVHLADDEHRARRQSFVQSVLETVPIEEYGLGVARAHAEVLAHVRRTGRVRGAHDLLIAATARASNRIVVSGDPSGFADLPGVHVRAIHGSEQ